MKSGTKCGCLWKEGKVHVGLRRPDLIRELEFKV